MNARIIVPYFKQGDDFHHHLMATTSTPEALNEWAETLEIAAKNLRRTATIISDYPNVVGDGDTHWASLSQLPEEALDRLLAEKLVEIDPIT
jgi:hypothetical protein